MSAPPRRPIRPKAVVATQPMGQSTLSGATIQPTIEMVNPGGPLPNAVERGIQKFAQLILYGVAMIAIWAALLSIAFDDSGDNTNFLFLGIGGLVSAGMAIGLVEFQRRKGGDELHSVHDYLIGMGFFFMAVGVIWGARWMMGILGENGVDWILESGVAYSDGSEWHPSANGIYIQMGACLLMVAGQYMYLDRLKGKTTFGWSVMAFAPLALVLVGFNVWMGWANNDVSWEIGIAIVSMTAVSMFLALRSDSFTIFAVVAVVSGLIPILYEWNNNPPELDGTGSAMSLLIFIIIFQGWLAADHRLQKDKMQLTSAFLVGEVILAMLIARSEDLHLVLGFLKQSELGMLSDVLTLQVALWLAVLLAYFPAALNQRIPYMPIGLAGCLFIIVPEAGLIPWTVTILMLPYLLIISDKTRKWVANMTVLAAGGSFFIQSYMAGGFHYEHFEALILCSLVITGEFARQRGNLSNWAHFSMLGLLVLSDSVLFGEDPWIPWIIVGYTIVSSWMMMRNAEINDNPNEAFEGSAATFASILITIILSWAGRLEMPFLDSITDKMDGFNLPLAIVGLGIYAAMRQYKLIELDLGSLLSWGDEKRKQIIPVFDSETNAWLIPEPDPNAPPAWVVKSWGPLGRMSLLGSMVLFTIAVATVNNEAISSNLIWPLAMLIPVGIVIKEVIDDDEASSLGRMIATWTIFAMALPVSMKMIWESGHAEELLTNSLVLDLILLSGPIGVSIMLTKKGLNDDALNVSADRMTFFGLLALGMLDSSGGILFLAMYLLVFQRSLKHRHNLVLILAPIALLLYSDRFIWDGATIGSIIGAVDFGSYDLTEITFLGLTRFSGIIMASTALIILGKGVSDRHNGLKDGVIETPMAAPAVWLAIGLLAVLPEASWLLLSLTMMIGFYSWLSGRIQFIPWMPLFTLVSFWFGFSWDSNFSHFTVGEFVSHTLLGTGFVTMVLNRMAQSGTLYRWADEPIVNPDASPSSFNLELVSGRERMIEIMRIWTLVCLTASYDAFDGIGTVLGALWATWDTYVRGQKYLILGTPLLQAFAAWNIIEHIVPSEQMAQDVIVGTVLMANGLLMTMLATKVDIAWSWKQFKWNDETDYYSWLDRIGIMAICYFLIGLTWALGSADIEGAMWTMWAVYLAGIAIQGFRDDTETPWRRGFGSFGTLFSIFMLSTTFADDLFTYVTWMLMGIVAFGFGILYMNRMGDSDTLYEQAPVAEIAEKVYESEEMEEGSDEATEEEEAEEEHSEDEVVVVEEDEEKVDEAAEEEAEEEKSLLALATEVDLKIPTSQGVGMTAGIVMAAAQQQVAQNVVPTGGGFSMAIDPQVMAAIQSTLARTPHVGFRPIISMLPNGNFKIDFAPL